MSRLWKADHQADRDMFERVGYVTVNLASRLAVAVIEAQTGVEFAPQAAARRVVYFRAEKGNERPMYEAFVGVIVDCIGRRSLVDPLCEFDPLPPPEWTPLAANVAVFSSTMPTGFYDTFKGMLRVWPDRFPFDDDN